MNRYPLWKNLLVVAVVLLGAVYSLPNIYAPDPAIQISGASGTVKMDEAVQTQVANTLKDAGIGFFGGNLQKNNLLIRLHDAEQQLSAKSLLEKHLGGDFVVALNLAPTTPDWLRSLGAQPMKLGLDLSGGVHFLLEVDTEIMLETRLEAIAGEMEDKLREAELASRKWNVEQKGVSLVVSFPTEEVKDAGMPVIRKEFPQLELDPASQNLARRFSLSDNAIREIEDYAVTQNLTSLRNRVNELGVSEPVVQRQGRNRIVVELPGVQDTAQAKRIIGKTANLEFRLEADMKERVSRKEEFSFRSEEYRKATLERKIILTGDRVTNARSTFDPETGMPQVNITLDGDGGTKMNLATRNNVGRRMGVLFVETKTDISTRIGEDGEEVIVRKKRVEKGIISLATIQSALGVQFRITGLDSPGEASELALLLRAGALAAPIDFVEERTVGPSAGADNIRQGMMSVQIGFLLVVIFMLVFYKVFGVAAVAALVVNLVVLVACMSILGATLTLPGIAGIVLTVGMAVDANVLIFSRVKEELKNGLSPHQSIEEGYAGARPHTGFCHYLVNRHPYFNVYCHCFDSRYYQWRLWWQTQN
jgi:preprotein translocase subunit SecD